MANRQRDKARRKAAAKAVGGRSRAWMWITVSVVVVAAIVGVVVVAGGDDEAASNGTAGTIGGLGALPTSQPVTVTGASLPVFDSKAVPDPAVGRTAPLIDGWNFNGGAIKVHPADGAYMLVFLAHWCPHCNAEVASLVDWKNSGAVPANLRVIGVATAVDANAVNFPPAKWFSDKGWPWPVMVDESTGQRKPGRAAKAFGAPGWPYFVIVGADGEVKVRVAGGVGLADLRRIVDDALAS